ncbi:MAG: helix-turn-helix transcriptional regulator [Prevotella sp.]|nr:helix-turn-helix transcriptional regulator [Prevotella sp.]MCI6403300.1 helix-turn-helix transcriptional regulator [Prevotella sp.]MCI6511289.1 helix-turn-helix transcriptional regulator [Prevotella sp.]MCI7270259.1 helix-turn-helix transcriptional regulator [Prevotella sp.]MCI7496499.1 helix-turn-helix transcriptional regulator [Prevotella sp.]
MRNPKPTNFARVLKKAEKSKFYLNPDLHMEEFARQIGTNRTYLSTYLNEEMGTCFPDYVNELRLEKAIELLDKGKHSHIKVAKMVGYNSEYTFRRLFKEKHGMTPREYALKKKEEREQNQ